MLASRTLRYADSIYVAAAERTLLANSRGLAVVLFGVSSSCRPVPAS